MPEDDERPTRAAARDVRREPQTRPAPPPGDDTLLAVRAGEGDEEAFATLVRRHTPVLLALATRVLDSRPDAEDAVQDAFVRAWRRLPEFRGDAAFLTWMYRIVTNRCLNLLRSRRPTERLDAAREPSAPEHQASPVRAAESTAAVKDLSGALAGLSPEQRACWVLRELHGLGYGEIADVLGISQQAVRGRIFRARRYLTEAMSAWR
ncbi:RNA polymerase sigma factor [Streptomyces sp. JJ66]|uniref:RNA polymerase sigma factor n=1 Tax=Streptomyces sp. JJ66 TaxID=2803843 RepID=UPI0035AE0E6D